MAKKYRADHVGSLLRPQAVLDAHAALREGKMSEDAVRQIEDKAILEALQMQRQVGIEVLSDGENPARWLVRRLLCQCRRLRPGCARDLPQVARCAHR